MKDEEHAHHDTHFQVGLDSLKATMAHLSSLLEQALMNVYGKVLLIDLSPLFKPKQ